ncbi:MAG: penicillin-binding protein 2 [Albidovulum sp.]|nr:penicillin-binding protein 2 [Albidovulum sp.]
MIRDEEKIHKSRRMIARRGILIAAGQLAAIGILADKLRVLQLTQASEYRNLAEKNRISVRLMVPERGRIFDRNGVVLADNRQLYRILIIREEAGDFEAVLDDLGKIIDIPPDVRAKKIEEIKNRRSFVPVVVAEDVDWNEFAAVSANSPSLRGTSAESGYSRIYPHGRDFAHLIGYVGSVDSRDRLRPEDRDPLLEVPDFSIGKTGIEAGMDLTLRGKSGIRKIEVNAYGKAMREIDRTDSVPGDNIVLSVDHLLQNYVHARMQEIAAGTAALLDIETGEVLALVSRPGFDPNKFASGITQKEFDEILQLKSSLVSRSVRSGYPPGSTFKMVTALAALEAGAISYSEKVFCGGSIESSNRKFHCWRRGGHGRVDFVRSIAESCDIYFYTLAEKVGIDRISAMARRLGIGVKFDLPIPEISAGLAPTKEWKLQMRSSAWTIGDTLNAGIGQGFVSATALQIAVMTARIASGRAVEPKIVKRIGSSENDHSVEPLGLGESWLAKVRTGMFEVVNNSKGTAFKSRTVQKNLLIAGKTGTSQIRNITAEERRRGVVRNEDLPWERRDHALFCGYIPADDPKIAAVVIVDHGGSGSEAAAPLARDMLIRAHVGEIPPLSAYPESQREEIRRQQGNLNVLRQKPATRARSRA